jgi:radical SAM superfamily enzyme YgiQ (UPF0313 family)/2-polyprenyl-3-methyl-5-hydroxy-6-metoxy-1,4-benzoquinol methylase
MGGPRFTLIVPNTRYREDYLWSVLPSRGLLCVAAALQQKSCPVQFIDADVDNLKAEQILDRIGGFDPAVVGLTLNTFQARAGLELARRIKERFPRPIVLAGGPHAQSMGARLLQEAPALDVVCPGEGEEVVAELADAVAAGRSFEGIRGIAYREKGEVRTNPDRPLIRDLDALPFPAFDLAGDLSRYPGAYPVSRAPSMHVMASRGCSFDCTFCSEAVFGRTVRFRTPKNVADEIELLHRDFGVREIFFQDDTMNLHRKWFYGVCDEIVARGLHEKVAFKTQFRCGRKLLDEELLARARAAGFWVVFYGVESGNQQVLDLMKKGTTLEEVRRAFALTHAAGLKTIASFMVGNDGDTRETIAETVALCKEIRPSYFGFSVATPIPGTEFYDVAKRKGWIESEDLRDYSEFVAVMHNDALTKEEITSLRDWADKESRTYLDRIRREEGAEESPVTGTGTPSKPGAGIQQGMRGVGVEAGPDAGRGNQDAGRAPLQLPTSTDPHSGPPPSFPLSPAVPPDRGQETPPTRGLKSFLRNIPILGPIGRYLWWWLMLPSRVNRITDFLNEAEGRGGVPSRAPSGRPGPAAPPMNGSAAPASAGGNGASVGAGRPLPQAGWRALDWASLPPEEVKRLMDERFAGGDAYGKPTRWDAVRHEELAARFQELMGRGRNVAEMEILDIGCGNEGLAVLIEKCRRFVGVDVSGAAVHEAARRYGWKPNFRFRQMDVTKLEFPDASFDAVAAREVLEHLPDPAACVREAFRVLRPGGVFVLSSPNRDSLHLRVNRMLGHPDFTCSYDHMREFGYGEMTAMLEGAGFTIRESAGVFCMPYWGIPQVDDPVRPLTDGDGRMLTLLRDLGRRVGPEYAFGYVIAAVHPS